MCLTLNVTSNFFHICTHQKCVSVKCGQGDIDLLWCKQEASPEGMAVFSCASPTDWCFDSSLIPVNWMHSIPTQKREKVQVRVIGRFWSEVISEVMGWKLTIFISIVWKFNSFCKSCTLAQKEMMSKIRLSVVWMEAAFMGDSLLRRIETGFRD